MGEGGADRRRKGGTRSQTKTAPQPRLPPQRLRSRSPKKPSPLGEGGPRQRWKGGTRWLPRLPHNQRTHPNHNHANKTAPNPRGHTTPQASSPPPSPNGPTSHPKGEAKLLTAKHVQKPKAVPLGNNKHKQNLHIKNSLSLGGEMSQRDREGRLAYKYRPPHNLATHLSDCEAGAKDEPSPLGEGGNSLTNIDCPPTSPPSPTHHANKIAPNPKGHTPQQASSPPPSPNGPTSHPKGEAKLLTVKLVRPPQAPGRPPPAPPHPRQEQNKS